MGGHKKKGKESTTSTLCGGLIFLGAFSKSFRGCGPLMTRIKMRYLNANIFFIQPKFWFSVWPFLSMAFCHNSHFLWIFLRTAHGKCLQNGTLTTHKHSHAHTQHTAHTHTRGLQVGRAAAATSTATNFHLPIPIFHLVVVVAAVFRGCGQDLLLPGCLFGAFYRAKFPLSRRRSRVANSH